MSYKKYYVSKTVINIDVKILKRKLPKLVISRNTGANFI